MRVYKSDEDQSQIFIGEDQIDHTPKDEKIRLSVGDAFDVVGERKQNNYKQLGDRAREETWEIKLRNHKLLVGPKGGWSEKDEEDIRAAGFTAVSLGRRVLRAETAAIAGSALIVHFWNE